jgi:hypothetical protein
MKNETDTAIAEFLAKGGVIQQAAYKESGIVEGTYSSPWKSGKRIASTVAELPPVLKPEEKS